MSAGQKIGGKRKTMLKDNKEVLQASRKNEGSSLKLKVAEYMHTYFYLPIQTLCLSE